MGWSWCKQASVGLTCTYYFANYGDIDAPGWQEVRPSHQRRTRPLVSQPQLDLDQVSKVPMPRPRNCLQPLYDFRITFSLDQNKGHTWFPSWFSSSRRCCSAAGASFTRECSGNKLWSTDFIPGWGCLSERFIRSRLAFKRLDANPTWQRTKTSLTYSHLIIKHSHLAIISHIFTFNHQTLSPCHNLGHGVEAMTGGHVDAEVPMVVPLDIFSWRTTWNFSAGTNFFLVHPSSLNRQV